MLDYSMFPTLLVLSLLCHLLFLIRMMGGIISATQAPQPAELVLTDSETSPPDSTPDVVDDLPDLLDDSNPKPSNTEVIKTLNTEMETLPTPADVSNTSEKNLVDSDNKRKFERTGIGTESRKRVTFSDEKILNL